MAKRDKKTITLGSGKIYVVKYTEATGIPEPSTICIDDNLLGYIKGGAALEYAAENYKETDDLGLVSKTIVTTEEAILKCGLLTWNGDTLAKLVDRCKTTTANGKRVTKIGGAGNAQGGSYVICFFHEDKTDGNLWVIIKGNNTAGFTLTFAADAGTVIEPEFTALPHDENGTLIQIHEETTTAAT